MKIFRDLLAATLLAVCLGHVGNATIALAQCSGWSESPAVGPTIRSMHSLVFDSTRGKVLLFGGYGPKPDGSEYLGDTWEFDGTSWTLRTTTGPAARQSAAMAFDSVRGRAVLFGGMSYSSGPITYGQTWEWNGTAWTTVSTSGPTPRHLHAMAYDAARQSTVMFGGLADGSFRDSATWTWNGSVWAQATTTGPATRFGHAMAYDASRQKVVLFGGFGGAGDVKTLLQDTWEWNGTTWSKMASAGPSPRQFHAMAFDPVRQRVVLFGGRGQDGTSLDDLWEWNGTSWSLASGTNAGARESFGMCFDGVRQKLIVAGGFSERGRLGDTWLRGTGTGSLPAISLPPVSQRVIPGSTLVLTGQGTGTGTLSYQWIRNGSAVVNNTRISGATTTTLTIQSADIFDSGQYSLRVSNSCGSATSVPASVDVTCPADVDNGSLQGVPDGAVEINDLIGFLFLFERGSSAVDIDNGQGNGVPDGGVDINDMLYFLIRFELGC